MAPYLRNIAFWVGSFYIVMAVCWLFMSIARGAPAPIDASDLFFPTFILSIYGILTPILGQDLAGFFLAVLKGDKDVLERFQ